MAKTSLHLLEFEPGVQLPPRGLETSFRPQKTFLRHEAMLMSTRDPFKGQAKPLLQLVRPRRTGLTTTAWCHRFGDARNWKEGSSSVYDRLAMSLVASGLAARAAITNQWDRIIKPAAHLSRQPDCDGLPYFATALSLGIFFRDMCSGATSSKRTKLRFRAIPISSLFRSLRYEGHPALWFVFLRGLGVLFDSPGLMLGAHWLLASLNAFLILWFCPIPPWQRIACCFGYFMLFEYGVICRDYAMGILLAFTFVAVHIRYKRAVVGPALILALLVHTTIPGALLAVSLLVFLLLEARASRRRQLAAIVIVGASVATMLSYVNPPADSLWAKLYQENRHELTVKDAIRNARMFLYVAAPIPRPDTLYFWNTNWTDSIAPDLVRRAIQYPGAALCLSLAAISLIHRRNVAVLFFVGTLMVAGFSIMHGQFAMRHLGQWFILWILCYWVGETRGDAEVRLLGGWQRKIRQFFPAIVIASHLLQLFQLRARSMLRFLQRLGW